MIAPQCLPTGNGLVVGTESLGKLSDAARSWPLPHGADQNDNDAEINLGAEESHRRRGHPLSATVTIAAKTEPQALWLGELFERAAWFTQIVCSVQASAAVASILAGGFGKVVVDGQKDGPESSGARQFVIHGRILRSRVKPRSTPLGKLDQAVRLFEGNFIGCLSDLAQNRPISRRLSCSRSLSSRIWFAWSL